MRVLVGVGVLIVVAGCNSRPSEPPVETGAFTLSEVTTTTPDAETIAVDRREVPLRELPLAPYLAGLPMTGLAAIAIDLRVPIVDGKRDHRSAVGAMTFACPDGCAIGDDATRLQPRGSGDGIPFGHIRFDTLDAHATVADGRFTLDRWRAVSKELQLEVALTIELASPFAASVLEGCVRFKAYPALAARDPKTAAVIATTGASVGDDGVSSIAIAGSVGSPKLVARRCADLVAR